MIPQIIKIVNSKSVVGIERQSWYFNTMIYLQTAGQAINKGLPFSVYGENLIVAAQCVVIIILIWGYDTKIGIVEKLVVLFGLSGYAFILFNPEGFIDEQRWILISQSNVFLTVLSRVPQIWANYKNQSTGQLAFFGIFLSFIGCVARIATVLVETDDIWYLMPFVTALTLNGILTLQFALYWNSTKAKVAEKKDK